MSATKLFQSIQVGGSRLKHRVVFAPSTRYRADDNHVPIVPLMKQYYDQRSKVPGTLLITEATFIAAQAGGFKNVPGIWSDDQVAAWKEITEAVHANGSFIYLQLWAIGRAANPDQLRSEDPSFPYVSASDVPLEGKKEVPRPLTVAEIKEYVKLYASAAENAVKGAGFDGVEIHSAHGYLLDQFLQDVSNKRTDEYGGSVENRARFPLEVADAVARAVGSSKTGIRLSPWSEFQGMRMEDPKPQFSYVVAKLRERHPDMAYIHLVEPRGDITKRDMDWVPPEEFSNDFIREIWAPKHIISAGFGFDTKPAFDVAERKGDIIAFSRAFIANPDLPFRLEHHLPLTRGNRDTYYLAKSPVGYVDYPFSEEFIQSKIANL